MVPGLGGVVEETLVAGLVGLHYDGGAVVALHVGALDHLVGHVDVLGVVLVVVDLEGLLADLGLKVCIAGKSGGRQLHWVGKGSTLCGRGGEGEEGRRRYMTKQGGGRGFQPE